MKYRCPKCGYTSDLLYPGTQAEWDQPCARCGNRQLEYFHFGYGNVPDHWVLIDKTIGNKIIGFDPCDRQDILNEA